jgi:hypothetical protein
MGIDNLPMHYAIVGVGKVGIAPAAAKAAYPVAQWTKVGKGILQVYLLSLSILYWLHAASDAT